MPQKENNFSASRSSVIKLASNITILLAHIRTGKQLPQKIILKQVIWKRILYVRVQGKANGIASIKLLLW